MALVGSVRHAWQTVLGKPAILRTKWVSVFSPRFLSALRKDDKPKRPTMLILFREMYAPDIYQKHPGCSFLEITQLIKERYRSLSAEEKQELEQRYQSQYKVYQVKYEEWKKSLTVDEAQEIVDDLKHRKEQKKKRQVRKLKKESEMPKRPKTSYMIFYVELLKERGLGQTAMGSKDAIIKMAQETAAAWKAMTPAEKKKYQDLHDEQKKVYEEQMKEWKDMMIKSGKAHVLDKLGQLPTETKSTKATTSKTTKTSKETKKTEKTGSGKSASTTKKSSIEKTLKTPVDKIKKEKSLYTDSDSD